MVKGPVIIRTRQLIFMNSVFVHSKFKLTVLLHPILLLEVKEGEALNVEDVETMYKVMIQLSNGENFAVLVDAAFPFSIEGDALKMVTSKEYSAPRLAAAMVTNSIANKLLGNFFINANRLNSPAKIFKTREEAIEWLMEVVKSKEQKSPD